MAEDRFHPSRNRQSEAQHRAAASGALVRCAECLKQIPAERAVKAETEDYVRHFCGLDCLHRWQRARHAR